MEEEGLQGRERLGWWAACSPTEQRITSLASLGGWKKSRPRPTASKLPIELEGKTGDQIARSSAVNGRERWGGSPTIADTSVRVGRPTSRARGRLAALLPGWGIWVTSTTR